MASFVVSLIPQTCEFLSTMNAFEWPVPGVCPHMYLEVALLREFLLASLELTYVSSPGTYHVLVDLVNPESVLARERLRAEPAVEITGTSVVR